jgi:Domain of unknown function (DUF4265)
LVPSAPMNYDPPHEPGLVRINFKLIQNSDGYPPVTNETLWAVPLGKGQFRVDNIPFFVCGVSCFDIVSAREGDDGMLRFKVLTKMGGHSTIRVNFYRESSDRRPIEQRTKELRDRLRNIGCSSELSHLPGLISIDIPPQVQLRPVISMLDDGLKRGLWDYEEASLAHFNEGMEPENSAGGRIED